MSDFQRPHCLQRDACAAAKPTTHCRRCSILRVGANPDLEAKRRAGVKALFEDPAYVAEHAGRLRAAVAKALQDPAFVERRREHGREQYRNHLSRPEVRAKARSEEARQAAGRKTSEKRMGWCPVQYRDEYRHLIVTKHVLAVDARKIIRDKIERARLAGLNPDLAAAHLRRITSVYRCDAAGKIDPVGTHWRYGTRVLERHALIKLAIDKGADPERLAA